jgi:hypothetical protein
MRQLLFGLLASTAIQTGCNPAQPTAPPTHQLPTATEVFNLRSECARLGVKVLQGNPAESGFTDTELSDYKEQTNRCYVEVSSQPVDLHKGRRFTDTLYDGQTGEMLAYTEIDRGTRSGIHYKERSDRGYEATHKYIEMMMKDE